MKIVPKHCKKNEPLQGHQTHHRRATIDKTLFHIYIHLFTFNDRDPELCLSKTEFFKDLQLYLYNCFKDRDTVSGKKCTMFTSPSCLPLIRAKLSSHINTMYSAN